MSKEESMNVDVRDLMHNITIRAHGLRGLGWRMWFAGKVIRLTGWVIKTPVELEIGETDRREIRKLALGRGDILVVRTMERLSHDRHAAMLEQLRAILKEAGRDDVKVVIADARVSFNVLSASSRWSGYQPSSGDRAPSNPPNQGSAGRRPDGYVKLPPGTLDGDPSVVEMRLALLDCIEALDSSAPCYDDYWAARKRAARAVGVPE